MGIHPPAHRRELRRRQIEHGAYHIRLRARADSGYDVQIDDAGDYANPS